MDCISFKKGYKYQIRESHICNLNRESVKIIPDQNIDTDYILLTADGELTIKKSYAWDGPSGPTIDTLNFMRGSLVHDALYQLIREEYLSLVKYRPLADKLLREMCLEDGMWAVRAWWVYLAVKWFGKPAADPANKKPIIKAPKGCL